MRRPNRRKERSASEEDTKAGEGAVHSLAPAESLRPADEHEKHDPRSEQRGHDRLTNPLAELRIRDLGSHCHILRSRAGRVLPLTELSSPAQPPDDRAERVGAETRNLWARRAIAILALLFLIKAAVLALFVTPLWDVPDEAGHYALVQDLADGRGLPLPGKSLMPENVMADWQPNRDPRSEPMENWVAQHPPLYHLAAVPLLDAARAVTRDPHWRFRAPRLLSAISGAAALLLFFQVFIEAGADPVLAFAAAAAVGFLPMYTHLSSGTNHDVFLALASGFAALYWVRLLKSGLFSDGAKMAVALALMGMVKFSALAVAAALVALSWKPLGGSDRGKFSRWLAIAAISISLPALWTLRHWLLLGNVRVHPVSRTRFALGSLLRYLKGDPVVDHSAKNFFGLIGWTGTGRGDVRWFQISGPYLALLLALSLAALLATAAWLARREVRARPVALLFAASVFAFAFLWLFAAADGSALPKRLLYSLLVAVPLLGVFGAFSESGSREPRIGSHLVFVFFAVAYLVNSWEAYEIYGRMRATNGRYFFAVLPFLAMAFLLPAAERLRPGRRRDLVLGAMVVALALDEAAFFLFQVVPFYRSGSLPITHLG